MLLSTGRSTGAIWLLILDVAHVGKPGDEHLSVAREGHLSRPASIMYAHASLGETGVKWGLIAWRAHESAGVGRHFEVVAMAGERRRAVMAICHREPRRLRRYGAQWHAFVISRR